MQLYDRLKIGHSGAIYDQTYTECNPVTKNMDRIDVVSFCCIQHIEFHVINVGTYMKGDHFRFLSCAHGYTFHIICSWNGDRVGSQITLDS